MKYLFDFIETLDSWIDTIEYCFGNFIDPPQEPIKNELKEKWCEKITARQAYRYAKYMYSRWRKTRKLVENADLSIYKLKKDRDFVKNFCYEVIKVADFHEGLYKRMYQRKLQES